MFVCCIGLDSSFDFVGLEFVVRLMLVFVWSFVCVCVLFSCGFVCQASRDDGQTNVCITQELPPVVCCMLGFVSCSLFGRLCSAWTNSRFVLAF